LRAEIRPSLMPHAPAPDPDPYGSRVRTRARHARSRSAQDRGGRVPVRLEPHPPAQEHPRLGPKRRRHVRRHRVQHHRPDLDRTPGLGERHRQRLAREVEMHRSRVPGQPSELDVLVADEVAGADAAAAPLRDQPGDVRPPPRPGPRPRQPPPRQPRPRPRRRPAAAHRRPYPAGPVASPASRTEPADRTHPTSPVRTGPRPAWAPSSSGATAASARPRPAPCRRQSKRRIHLSVSAKRPPRPVFNSGGNLMMLY